MEEKLTPEMKEVIAKLGELVKADERCTRIQSTISDYEHSEELTALIGEYNTQQTSLPTLTTSPRETGPQAKNSSPLFRQESTRSTTRLQLIPYTQLTLRRRTSLTRSHRRSTRSFSSLSQANVPAHTTAHPAAAPAAVTEFQTGQIFYKL